MIATVRDACATELPSFADVLAAENAEPLAREYSAAAVAPFWAFLERQNLVPVAVRVRDVEAAAVPAATSVPMLPVVVRAAGDGAGAALGGVPGARGAPVVIEQLRNGRFLNLIA